MRLWDDKTTRRSNDQTTSDVAARSLNDHEQAVYSDKWESEGAVLCVACVVLPGPKRGSLFHLHLRMWEQKDIQNILCTEKLRAVTPSQGIKVLKRVLRDADGRYMHAPFQPLFWTSLIRRLSGFHSARLIRLYRWKLNVNMHHSYHARPACFLNDILQITESACVYFITNTKEGGVGHTGINKYGTLRSYSSQASPYLARQRVMSRHARCAIMQQKKRG